MLYSLQCEYSLWDFKAALCSFGEEIQTQIIIIYNINEVTIQTQKCSFSHNWRNKLFSEENKKGPQNTVGS